ncbi:MAG: hypothetical protein GXO39_01775 [Thermotogae bacterium]|nr:hypothetical protein [Thermotogota bacterium]
MHAEIKENMVEYGKKLMEAVNDFVANKVSPEYDPEDIKIGHTYFMGESVDEIAYKFLYQVVPLLYEYIQDGLIRAERVEEKEENNKKRFKGYKITLNGDEFYIRGGRLYKKGDPTKPITLSEMENLLETSKDSNNGEENADSKQKNPEESQQPEK